MAALCTGVSLSFGLINTSVSVYSALETKPKNVTVCTGTSNAHEPTRVTQLRHCAECGEIAYADVHKAREVAGGYVLLDAEEIATARLDANAHKKAASLTPHPAADVESGTVPGEKLYHLVPEKGDGHAKAYAVLRHLVQTRPDLAFMTIWTPRTSAAVFRLQVRGEVLVLQERVLAAATKPAPGVVADAPDALLAMAEAYLSIDGVVTAYDADLYDDSFEAAIQELIAGKTAVALAGVPAQSGAPAPSADLMASLAAHVAANSKPKKKTTKKKVTA